MARITIASLQSTIDSLRADMERITAQQCAIIKAQAATIQALEAKLVPAAPKLVDDVPAWVDEAPADEYTETRPVRRIATPAAPIPVGKPYTRRDGCTYQKLMTGFNRYVERRVS